MLFRVTEQTNDYIILYYVPDDAHLKPRLRVEIDQELFSVEPSWSIPDLVKIGRHHDGLCGFRVDIANYKNYHSLAIIEDRTDFVIYKRTAQESAYTRRRVIIPTLWTKNWSINPDFLKHFEYVYEYENDLTSEETLSEVLINHCQSVCIIGNPPLYNILPYLHTDNALWLILDSPRNLLVSQIQSINCSDKPDDWSNQNIISLSNPLLKALISMSQDATITSEALARAYSILAHTEVFATTEMAHNTILIANSSMHATDASQYSCNKIINFILEHDSHIYFEFKTVLSNITNLSSIIHNLLVKPAHSNTSAAIEKKVS